MGRIVIKDRAQDRYHALSISSIWDLETVRGGRALVAGAGALGNEVVKSLTLMGSRLVAIVDRDTVEVANLTRSIFFREPDHGRLKAEVLSARLRELNPDVEALPIPGDIQDVVGLGLVRRFDMIFSCFDNRLARHALGRMCHRVGRPWVDGAMEDLLGDVTVYAPDTGPCYECTLGPADLQIIARATSCAGIAQRSIALGKVPTTPTMGSIVAAVQVQEGLKLLHGYEKRSLAGRRLVINGEVNDVYVTAFERKEGCQGHERFGEIVEVPSFRAATTPAQDLLDRYRDETGEPGHLRLGRNLVVSLRCHACLTEESLFAPLRSVDADRVRCPGCGEGREALTTNVVRGTEPWKDRALAQIGVPPLEVLQVMGGAGSRFYELTGDLALYPEALR
jgi:molybdopterin/thiamine biosynthesis adenylyltransferase